MKSAPTRVRVKICGVTNRADAEAAVALGADALGFNTYAGSKRHIDLRREAAWISGLPMLLTKVAVMVNPSIDEAAAALALPFIDVLQLHGDEDVAFCAALADRGMPFLKAIRLRSDDSFASIEECRTKDIVLDAYSPSDFGGTGKLIDLDLAAKFALVHPEMRVVLSGGLTAENVAAAIAKVRPYAVDVASGVEMAGDPRRKDPARVAAFIAQCNASHPERSEAKRSGVEGPREASRGSA